MKNKTQDNIIIAVIIIVVIVAVGYLLNLAGKKVFGKLIDYNPKTETKYIDCGKYDKVVYADDTEVLIGNGKTEYENGEIC